MTMQDKILAKIAAMASDAGLEANKQSEYANTGSVFLSRKDDITPFASIGFNFQSGSYTLRIKWNGTMVQSQPPRKDYFDFYQAYDQLSSFWKQFAMLLNTL